MGGVLRTTLRLINDDAWEGLRAMFTVKQVKECMELDGMLSYSPLDEASGGLTCLIPIITNTDLQSFDGHLVISAQ